MNPILKNIIDLLNVEELEQNLYRGQNHKTEHVFGGQVLAQAIAAGFRTVEADHDLHSIHSYFIRLGDWNVSIIYEVDRIRDGRSWFIPMRQQLIRRYPFRQNVTTFSLTVNQTGYTCPQGERTNTSRSFQRLPVLQTGMSSRA